MNMSSFKYRILLQFYALYIISISGSTCPVPSSHSDQTPEYYWKDYTGTIPKDAIEGGTDESGNPTYVGQAYFEKYELLPVVIFVGCKSANATAYHDEITTDKNIKILCGKYKEKFEWVVTKNEDTHLLVDHHLIVGGYEVGQTLNIGRVQHDGKIVSGKVFSYPLSNRGLWIPYKGTPINFLSYEILTYNVNKILVFV